MSTRDELTALDWIGALLAFTASGFPISLPRAVAPTFRKMFLDLGGPMPEFTRLVLTEWFPYALGLIPLGLIAAALAPASTIELRTRRRLIVASCLLGLIASGLCLYGLYAPIFHIAGAISP